MQQTITDATAEHPFQTPVWQRIWWAHRGCGRLLRVALGDAGTATLAVGDDGVARFPGDTETTDYPGPGVGPEAMDALLGALGEAPSSPQRLDARDLSAESAAALADAAARAGLACRVGDDEPVARLALPADGDPATWRAGLTRHARHELARKRRRLREAHPDARVRTATPATLDADLDAFCALHRASPDPAKARFLTPSLEAFLRDVAHAFVDTTLRLDVLDDGDGRALAATLGFAGPTTFFLYNMGFDPAAGRVSPGLVLVAALVQRAITGGGQTFDFLRGLERYKLELGARPVSLQRVEVTLR